MRRRNADVTTFIEDKALFKPSLDEVAYVGGGDGTMILDHEFVLVRLAISIELPLSG